MIILGDWVPFITQKKAGVVPLKNYIRGHHNSLRVVGRIKATDTLKVSEGLVGRIWYRYVPQRRPNG